MKFVKIALALAFVAFVSCSNSSSDNTDEVQTTPPAGDTTIITLKGTTAEFVGKNVNIKENDYYGTIVEITSNGIYLVQGTLNQGFVAVSKKDLDVTIILNNVNITCKNYSALTSLKKSNVTLVLAANTANYITDGGEGIIDGKYDYGYDSEEQPNAALMVRKDLTIKGSGKLIVNGNGNNGIGSRASLKIESGDITINAVKNALKGNDSVVISGGNFTISSDNKAIRADERITINGGNFTISSGDDAIRADERITINGGNFTISSGDDAIRADERITINDGNINIIKCYEGIEAYNIDLNGGFVRIKASDDGINISDTAKTVTGGGGPGRPGQGMGGNAAINGKLTITGGEYYIESTGGDGIDSNGSIEMTGGTVVSIGPSATNSPEVPLDFDGTFAMTGGLLVALGNAGNMLQQPSPSGTTQYSFLAKFSNSPVSAGSLINVSSNSGTEVVTIKAVGITRSLMVCSPLLNRETYAISSGGSHSGSENALGLYEGGAYSGGSAVRTFTISNITTTVN